MSIERCQGRLRRAYSAVREISGAAVALAAKLAATLAVGGLLGVGPAHAQAPTPWLYFGGDLNNSRANLSQDSNIGSPIQISPHNAPKLALKWKYSTQGDIVATPTVEAGGLYVPDNVGWLYKLDPATGALIWSHYIGNYLGAYGYSRTSPAIGALGEIVVGIQSTFGGTNPGARIISVNRTTGALNWTTIVDTTTHSYVTTSPVIYNGLIYSGVAANEEVLIGPGGITPTFRGSVFALNEATGKIVWQMKTAPAGYTGASVWGNSPVIFTPGHALLVGTGNNITVSASATTCLAKAAKDFASQLACLDPTDYVDSLLSLDLVTGKLNWGRRFDVDAWNGTCGTALASYCPTPAGDDVDFASMPNLVYVNNFIGVPDDRGGTSQYYLIGAGQKSGYYHGVNPYNGGQFWTAYMGKGEILRGSALNTDDRNSVFVALNNDDHYTNTLVGSNGTPIVSNGGAWASVLLPSGTIKWQIPAYGADVTNPQVVGASPGAMAFTNRVVFAGSTSGYMVAMDATTGLIYWKFNAGAAITGGPAIYNETLYWGAGTSIVAPGKVHTLFAFAVPPPA